MLAKRRVRPDPADGAGARPVVDISPALTERFGQIMRERLTSGEIPFRKAFIGAIVDRIEVDDRQIRIMGRKDVLEAAVTANGGTVPGVRSIVRKWRGIQDKSANTYVIAIAV